MWGTVMETRHETSRRLSLGWLGVFLAVGLLVAFFNSSHDIEQGIYRSHYVPMAEHFESGTSRDPMTYPIWGYPLVLAALSRNALIVPLQVLLSSVSMFLLYLVMRSQVGAPRGVLEVLFVAGWPWYTLHSVRWPMSPAVSLTILSLLLLWLSLRRGRWWPAVVGGILAGAALNFRSDFLFLGAFALVLSLVSRIIRRERVLAVTPVAIYILVAVLCLIPWGLHYKAETGHFSLTSSHGGMVAYITLGQLVGNPWGIVHNDGSARDVVEEVDPEMLPYSDQGNRILIDRFLSNIKSHPGAYAKKVAGNLADVFVGGFYNGEPGTGSAETDRSLEILKEKLKTRFGFHPNAQEIAAYKESGEWDDFSVDPASAAVTLLLLAATALGAAFLIVSLLGLVASARRITSEPFYMLMASIVIYQCVSVSLLQYQPRHVNAIYLCSIPFFLPGARLLFGQLARLRSGLRRARS